MALFVQIDHFRKTDQKPTVKNHLFSISWFRSFNRTSFQQQLKRDLNHLSAQRKRASIVHPFNNNWNIVSRCDSYPHNSFNRTSFQQQLKLNRIEAYNAYVVLQSYILSTTTETIQAIVCWERLFRFNRTSFQQQLKRATRSLLWFWKTASIVHPFNNNWNFVVRR